MEHQRLVVIDFGANTAQSIARKIRSLKVYSEIKPFNITPENLSSLNPQGLVLSEVPTDFSSKQLEQVVKNFIALGLPMLAERNNPVIQNLAQSNKRLITLQGSLDSEENTQDLKSFLFEICGLAGDWSMSSFLKEEVERIKNRVGNGKVLCALSGGVDSSVAATLVHRAIGDNLTSVFVDHGLMRKDEGKQVVDLFRNHLKMKLVAVDASKRFLSKLAGVAEPELKRKIIGNEFIRVFEEEASKLGNIDYLVQGTLYPDVIESGVGASAVIKSHHNVGGLPEDMKLELIEPLSELFKDEVRELGLELGLPERVVFRQPFPGPGLGIRCLGEITEEKLGILREADYIMRRELVAAGLERAIWQSFTVLPDLRSVGQLDGKRTYCHTIVVRAVNSIDGMTANWVHIPFEVLEQVSKAITKELPIVNRVVYDITSKPPATIEWE